MHLSRKWAVNHLKRVWFVRVHCLGQSRCSWGEPEIEEQWGDGSQRPDNLTFQDSSEMSKARCSGDPESAPRNWVLQVIAFLSSKVQKCRKWGIFMQLVRQSKLIRGTTLSASELSYWPFSGLLLHEKCFFNNDPPLLCSRHISVHGYAIDLSMLQSVNRCEEAKNCKAGKGHLVQRVWPFRFISNRPPCFVLASANLLSPHKKSLAVS